MITTSRACILATALVLAAACSDGDISDEQPDDTLNNGASDTDLDEPDGGPGDVGDADDAGEELEPLPEQPWDVTEPGFYGVGFRKLELTYAPAGFEEARSVEVLIWYPTRATEGELVKYLGVRESDSVLVDATVGIDSPAPVMVRSHGDKGLAEDSFFFAEYFASHGWIVAAPSHTGNTLLDFITPRPPWMFDVRPQDISQTLDTLYGLPDDDPLAGLVSEDVAVSGHSYGGYTTFSIGGASYDVEGLLADCQGLLRDDEGCPYISGEAEARYRAGFGDARVKAIIPMAPGNSRVFREGLADIEVPILHMTGVLDKQVTKAGEGDPIWDWLAPTSAIRLQFPRGGHLTFNDFCTLTPGIGTDDGCGDDFTPVSEAHPIINAYSMAFVRFHLWGDATDEDLLTGARTLSEEALLLTR